MMSCHKSDGELTKPGKDQMLEGCWNCTYLLYHEKTFDYRPLSLSVIHASQVQLNLWE